MPDERDTYTDAQRRAYVPSPCPDCGHQADWRAVQWRASGKPDGLYVKGNATCPRCHNRKGPDPFADLMP